MGGQTRGKREWNFPMCPLLHVNSLCIHSYPKADERKNQGRLAPVKGGLNEKGLNYLRF